MRRAALPVLLLVLPLAACGGGDDETLTVLAAASLTQTFTELAETFEDEHPGVEVELVLGSSTTLAEQAVQRAPGDVLATADERAMRVAQGANVLADAPAAFASNSLTLVTPPDNPADIVSLADLDDRDVDFVVCAVTAPCGALASSLLDQHGIARAPASEEIDVKAVLARVSQGEADAGLVYRTDAAAAEDDVAEVPLPETAGLTTDYFVAPLRSGDAKQAGLAAEFVALVESDRASELLARAGFGSVVGE